MCLYDPKFDPVYIMVSLGGYVSSGMLGLLTSISNIVPQIIAVSQPKYVSKNCAASAAKVISLINSAFESHSTIPIETLMSQRPKH